MIQCDVLTNEQYFKRYEQHLSQLRDGKKAWIATERDLFNQTHFRRYLYYTSFMVCLSRYRADEISDNVKLKYVRYF